MYDNNKSEDDIRFLIYISDHIFLFLGHQLENIKCAFLVRFINFMSTRCMVYPQKLWITLLSH